MYLPKPRSPGFTIACGFFSRALAAIFFCAFASLLAQVRGLLGPQGLAPAEPFLEAVWRQLGAAALWQVPTLCWLNADNDMLMGLCVLGMAVALLMGAGVAPGACSLVLWVLYLSLVSVGGPFLNFQWDALLLETALLAAFALPWRLRPCWETDAPVPRFARWLLWWLLFRLMFESGVVKLASRDPTWSGLTALDFHFATQPLPLWTAWFAHQAPRWMLRGATLLMFAIELLVPWFIFAPRRLRHAGAWALIALQAAILATGNYAFFNLLTIALCALLFDDDSWPCRWRKIAQPALHWTGPRPRWIVPVCASVSGLVALLSVPPFLQMVGFLPGWAGPLAALRSFNGYGLFANMTTQRPEIIIEGSDEGVLWLEYEFPWKPGDLRARPRLVAPHQPRLDWQLWFAALGGPGRNRWFGVLLQRLLEGQPEVLGLLETNPFPKHPPRYIRALLYQYHFTRAGEGGAWWRRELQGTYWPASSLGPPGPPPPPAPQMKACTAPPRRDVSSNKTALTRVYSHESSMP